MSTVAPKRSVWPLVLILLSAVSLLVAMAVWRLSRPPAAEELLRLNAVELPAAKTVSWPELSSELARPLAAKELEGQWTLVFFGFTHCADICPATMSLLASLARRLEGDRWADDTGYLMVSVDPARDTPQRLKQWLGGIGAELRGATGDLPAVRGLAAQFGVAFQRLAHSGPDYQLAHSGNIFIVDPDNRYRGFIRAPESPQQLEQAYRSLRLRAN